MHHSILGTVALLLVVSACGGGPSSPPPSSQRDVAPAPARQPAVAEASPVAPIPAGHHSVTPMLVVADVPRAIELYGQAFGAEQAELATDPDSGAALHAELRIGDSIVMLSPENERGARAPSSVGGTCGALLVYVEDVDAALARATGAGARAIMPATDMFWGDCYAQVEDPFGHRWSLATHRYDIPDDEVAERAQAWSTAMARHRRPPRFEPGEPASSHVPEGFFTVTPSLVIGSADDIDGFVAALGAEERNRLVDPAGNLSHAEIRIGDSIVMLSGEERRDPHMKTPEHLSASPVSLMYYTDDVDDVFAHAIAAGATQRLAVTDMFWGDRLGMVGVPAGHCIGIATHVADVAPDELQRRMHEHHPAD